MTIQKTNHSPSFLLLFDLLLLSTLQYAAAQFRTIPPPPPQPFNIGSKFNPSMAVIMIVLVSAFFFLGFFSVYIRQCAERRFRGAFDPGQLGGTSRRSRRTRGLDSAIIATFPTFLYSAVKGLKIGKGSLECAVCLNEFEDDETLRLLPKCSHVFHTDCVDIWLANHITCPVCRANLVPKPGEILSATIQIPDPDIESEPTVRSNPTDPQNDQSRDSDTQAQPPEVNLINQNRPPRSRSTGLRFIRLFPRSHSTGHSLVQPGENCERFTLRLPEEVRSKIMNSALPRTKSCVAFPRVRSSRRGFRSASGNNYFRYERFDRDVRADRWGFSMTPPFISRTGSVKSPKVTSDSDEVVASPTKTLFRSVRSARSPLDRLFVGNDDFGEPSSDRLRPDGLDGQV